jgi:hypothetical protein
MKVISMEFSHKPPAKTIEKRPEILGTILETVAAFRKTSGLKA